MIIDSAENISINYRIILLHKDEGKKNAITRASFFSRLIDFNITLFIKWNTLKYKIFHLTYKIINMWSYLMLRYEILSFLSLTKKTMVRISRAFTSIIIHVKSQFMFTQRNDSIMVQIVTLICFSLKIDRDLWCDPHLLIFLLVMF